MLESVIYTSDSLSMKNAVASINEEHMITELPKLHQNSPNPFNHDTEIKMNIPSTSNSAKLFIYNVQGKQIKSINILDKGLVSTNIKGSELEPGIYLYSLIIDGQEISTKRMILTD